MEYKDTLNLPRTNFPMRANLPVREPARVEQWEQTGLYQRILDRRAAAPLFLLHDGPPYANGEIHLGHALNKVLKDIVLKFKSLSGYRAPYRPGWDCHGLPIELQVEKKLGRAKKAELGVVEVRRRCQDYARRFVGVQREDFRRLGVLGDWDRPYLTMDRDFEAREARELAAVIAAGSLYRGRKPVHWCASCRTALAEAEVDYDNHRSLSVFVAFRVCEPNTGVLAQYADRAPEVVIWTTTPWTLPANLAIALHPAYRYALVECGERTFIVAEAMLDAVGDGPGLRQRLGLGQVLASFCGEELAGLRAQHPWIDRDSLLIVGDHVTLEAGTGCVHTAPGHGQDDYVVGQRYGLDTYAPVDAAGCFTEEVEGLAGRRVFDADSDIVELLDSRGALLASEEIDHSYPHCWRCKRPIIFRATDQWFISMEAGDLRQRSLAWIDQTTWIPEWGRERIRGMISGRPDWCLSRQRTWGVPLIALRCCGCDQSVTSEKLVLHVAELFESEGSDAWFERSVDDLLPPGFVCPHCEGTRFERERDIVDVWFDSGVSFATVVEAEHGSDTIADLYLEGSDQHRGWFHSALLTSVITRDRAPYKAVLTHGFVLDGDGRKMSKSLGNTIVPQKIIKQYGADILRLWVASEDYRDDMRVSPEILKRLADSYRRVRNTARNLLGNIADFDPSGDTVAVADMVELDRWILGRLHSFIERCREAYERYEFHVVYHALNNFCSVDLSSLYFDIVKDRLYCCGRDSRERRSAQTAMYEILSALTRVIAPIMPFTSEEIWEAIPLHDGHAAGEQPSVFLGDFPQPQPQWLDQALARRWDRIWEIRAEVTKALEARRKSGEIGHSLDARVVISVGGGDAELLESVGEDALASLYIVSQVELTGIDSDTLDVAVLVPLGSKCSRCWNYAESVGGHADHPEICDRCHAAVVAAQ